MFKNLKLGTKLIGSFVAILILTAAISFVGYSGMAKVVSRVEKSDDVAAIVKMIGEVRQQEKNFIIRKDKSYVDKVHELVAEVAKQASATKDKFMQKANRDQMDEIINQGKEYSKAFDHYVELTNKKDATMEAMRTNAREALKLTEDIRADLKKQLEEVIKSDASHEQVNDRITKADDANRLIKWFLDVRKNEKEFIISGDEKYLDAVKDNIGKILNLAADLKSRLINPTNIQASEAIIAAIKEYDLQFSKFIAFTEEQKKADELMVAAAREAQKVCADARDDQKAKMAAEIGKSNTTMITFSLIAIAAGLGLAFLITRSITTRLGKAVDVLKEMSKGNIGNRLKMDSTDEIGQMAAAMDAMAGNLTEMIKEIDHGVATLSSSSTEMAAIADQMASGAETTVAKSNTVAAAAEEMNSNMTSVAAAMEQATTNISTVASGTEEMSASIADIAQNTSRAKGSTSKAVERSDKASSQVNELGRAAEEIEVVTETIKAISDKTNLLALNATIEAARAGEAGKGFAVVANEIKDLAQQTADATGDIAKKLQGIQQSTGMTVSEIREVSEAIKQVDEIVSAIAAAVEQQNSASKEISENVGQASMGLKEINENVTQTTQAAGEVTKEISEVNESANEMSNSSAQIQQSAGELSKLSEQLKLMVSKFKL
ncbi:MAG: methyl-accepting chemotaxis protein [Thermodesulfobacteriota bacterium]